MVRDITPYFKKGGDLGCLTYKKLNPTGRWKLKTIRNGENLLYIEHKGWLFKRWIFENDIVFVPSLDEDRGLITCGNAILSGSLPTCEYVDLR